MTLLRDLIHIPEHVGAGDFVMRLDEAERHAARVVADYVVTPQLAECFQRALGLIHKGVESGTSQGAYLHGSFGSGKSHFMAVLQLLLAGNADARGITALHPVLADHDQLTRGKLLLVPFFMLNADTLEHGVLGQYTAFMARTHPEAAQPALLQGDQVFTDAARQRERMGDEAFFAELGGDGRWGTFAGGWDDARYAAAVAAPAGDPQRRRLIVARPQWVNLRHSHVSAHLA